MLGRRGCPGCGSRGWSPCPACCAELTPAGDVVVDGARVAVALIEFDGPGRSLIHALKFDRCRDLAPWFAAAMSPLVAADVDLVTWLPTTAARRRERGYDQARLLARALGRSAGIPVAALLRRHDDAAPHTGAAAAHRDGPVLVADPRARGRRVLLVDDVLTTGSSARAATRALRRVGARSVDVLVVARTAAPGEPPRLAATPPRAI